MSSSRTNSHLKKKQLEGIKDSLMSEIERIETKLAAEQLMRINDTSGRDEVDAANDDILKHTELRFSTRETLYLKKLRKMLPKLDSDEYGMCEDCGSQITFQRLKARPTSTMCISCKEESERDEYQNFHGRKSTSLGVATAAAAR